MLYLKRLALVAAVVLMTATGASATPLFIDFGAAEWQSHADLGTSSASLTYGDLTVTVSASVWGDHPAKLISYGGGLGITERHGKFGQIGFAETMKITFSRPVVIHGFAVSHLADGACYGRFCFDGEYGKYSVDGGDSARFGPGNAQHQRKVGVELVGTSLELGTHFNKHHLFDDFVLRGISVWPELRDTPGGQGTGSTPTPEPTAALLFGAGLIAVSARARSRRN